MNRIKNILSGVCCIATIASTAQSSYKDSIAVFQLHYKSELYSIIKDDTAHIKFYPAETVYRVTAFVEKLSGEKFFPMATSSGITKQAIKYARLRFTLDGKAYILYGYQLSTLLETEKYKNDFFIPFTDGTTGTDSYMGGKYIDFSTTDISDNKLVIDFNRSYNPYCAFRKGYNCPIPPKENTLTAEIRAGEMNFDK
ncbi:MAG TPA: DUF1684 domain-containing protein [Chitinophagaceae bacterium]|nr:DUF1684 domain-containing protein [Chitinophagaceae bacterium]